MKAESVRDPRLRSLPAAVAMLAAGIVVACAPAAEMDDAGTAVAPDVFVLAFETSKGDFEVEFVRAWSPLAVDRVWALARASFWDGARLYRVNDRYAQFGYSGRPTDDANWIPAGIPDEPPLESNVRGTVSFARGGPGTRSAILFVNRGDNTNLDDLPWNGVIGFPPVGRVTSGLDVIDALESRYGDDVMQWEDSISALGNPFLDRRFPGLDIIERVRVAEPDR